MKIKLLIILTVAYVLGVASLQAQPFKHPGLLQSREDLQRIRTNIALSREPLYSGYIAFKNHPQSQSDYKMQGPMISVGRNPTVGQGRYDADANAAYQNAMMWAVTGEQRYAQTAKEIINAWCSSLRSVTGRDAVLMAGLGPFKMVNAAEILRYTNAGWNAGDVKQAEVHFKTVIYPVIKDLAPFANGNWDSAALKTIMAIAIFCNEREIFERALIYYQHGSGDGSLLNYIINDEGQCQESGRDQGHTQLGIAHLVDCAEMAWNQGLDLYRIYDYRLLKGFEYTAKYNLGMDVPYSPAMDKTGKYLHARISELDRGKLRAVYEEVYNHYVNRIGLQAPYTRQAAEKVRPELQGLPGADHMGFGTFLYTRSRTTTFMVGVPVSPGGVFATFDKSVKLTWVPVAGASSYIVKRSKGGESLFRVIASDLTSTTFSDEQVKKGVQYTYTVCAVNKKGRSEDAHPTTIFAGLSAGWKMTDFTAKHQGTVTYDGQIFTVEGAGLGLGNPEDKANFLTRTVDGNALLQARYVPQLSSQFTGFGLTFCESIDQPGNTVELLVSPQSSRQVEAPGWVVQLRIRSRESDSSKVIFTSPVLNEPAVTFSRLTGHLWLKLQRKENQFNAAYSTDGKEWITAGSVQMKLANSIQTGVMVYSGIKEVTTTVKFDQVKVLQPK
jgi:hypothetical protein